MNRVRIFDSPIEWPKTCACLQPKWSIKAIASFAIVLVLQQTHTINSTSVSFISSHDKSLRFWNFKHKIKKLLNFMNSTMQLIKANSFTHTLRVVSINNRTDQFSPWSLISSGTAIIFESKLTFWNKTKSNARIFWFFGGHGAPTHSAIIKGTDFDTTATKTSLIVATISHRPIIIVGRKGPGQPLNLWAPWVVSSRQTWPLIGNPSATQKIPTKTHFIKK